MKLARIYFLADKRVWLCNVFVVGWTTADTLMGVYKAGEMLYRHYIERAKYGLL